MNRNYRNGIRAVEIMAPMPPTDQMSCGWIDTLAAADAAIDDVEQATSLQEQAIAQAEELGADLNSIEGPGQKLQKFARREAVNNTK